MADEEPVPEKLLLSFYSATLAGRESVKRSLLLADCVVVPTSRRNLDKEMAGFADGNRTVRAYLGEHLLPLCELAPQYDAVVSEMLEYFGRWHSCRWLSPDFEQTVGDFLDQTQAEISWAWSVRLDSLLLSKRVHECLGLPAFSDASEEMLAKLPAQGSSPTRSIAITDAHLIETTKACIPDVADYNWDGLVAALGHGSVQPFRSTLWASARATASLRDEYVKALEAYFRETFQESRASEVAAIAGDAVIGTVLPPLGPLKALYEFFETQDRHKRYSWLSVVQRLKNSAPPGATRAPEVPS